MQPFFIPETTPTFQPSEGNRQYPAAGAGNRPQARFCGKDRQGAFCLCRKPKRIVKGTSPYTSILLGSHIPHGGPTRNETILLDSAGLYVLLLNPGRSRRGHVALQCAAQR